MLKQRRPSSGARESASTLATLSKLAFLFLARDLAHAMTCSRFTDGIANKPKQTSMTSAPAPHPCAHPPHSRASSVASLDVPRPSLALNIKLPLLRLTPSTPRPPQLAPCQCDRSWCCSALHGTRRPRDDPSALPSGMSRWGRETSPLARKPWERFEEEGEKEVGIVARKGIVSEAWEVVESEERSCGRARRREWGRREVDQVRNCCDRRCDRERCCRPRRRGKVDDGR